MLVKTATCYRTQRGLTLLEVLLASVISSVLILTVSRLIVSEFRVTERLSRQMQLHQQLRTSLALIKRNLLMAGFNAAAPVPVFFRGSQTLTDVRYNTQVGYVYQESATARDDFHHVVYQLAEQPEHSSLRLCEKQHDHRFTFEQAASSGESGPCFSLFDTNWIRVDTFQVRYQPLQSGSGAPINTGWVTVHLGLSLVADSSIHESADFAFLQRHWSL
ncbi:prepilin-type N-terminal cleavage/methylation domain-containing protein [Vibrio ruber]|uniref:PulJ/GspJ family protein n=1 Tax=Vibrio ruber TaxID=184755 RepID=UPI00289311B1|nr:prepilin-type N-terminal cleavage/methylation domain-containing protein [Vibrio ruber]WNJ95858.1 prepilin-type N-terminal cleavage/methylation domain-containing protein [Vibrio ruber]